MSHRLKILGISENQNEAYTVSLLSYLYVLLEFLLKEPQKPIPSDSSLTFCGLFSHKDQNVRLRFDVSIAQLRILSDRCIVHFFRVL